MTRTVPGHGGSHCLNAIAVAAACLAAAAPASAIDDPGKVGFGFLGLAKSARAEAMGSMGTIFAEGSESVFWNPSFLDQVERPQFVASGASWFEEAQLFHAAGAFPAGSLGGIGVSLQALGTDSFSNIPDETEEGQSDAAFGLSLGRHLSRRLSVGGALRYLRSELSGLEASGAAYDVGLNYALAEGWNFSGAVRNAGSALSYGNGPKEQLPTQMGFGLAGTSRGFRYGAEAGWENGRGWDGGIGAEYYALRRLALRLGTRVASEKEDALEPWSAGFGVLLPASLRLDFAFRDGPMNAVQRLDLTYGVGLSSEAKPQSASARDFYSATLEEALDRCMVTFPQGLADTLGVRPRSASDADTLVVHALASRLQALGYTVKPLTAPLAVPASLDSSATAKLQEKVDEQKKEANRYVLLEYELRKSRYAFSNTRRERWIGPQTVDRVAEVEIDLGLVKAGTGESLWSSSGRSSKEETVAVRDIMPSGGFPKAEVAVDSKKLHPMVEPAIVGGIVSGLVLIFFSNRDVGK